MQLNQKNDGKNPNSP